MSRNKISKILMMIMLLGIIFQIRVLAYPVVDYTTVSTQAQFTDSIDPEIRTADNTQISDGIKNIIKTADPENYERNITNYKNLLINFNVQERFKNEIEALLKKGYKLPDILTAYEYLNINFGRLEELRELSTQKQSGKTWTENFKAYDEENSGFVPRAFDPDYLESLMKEPNITSDDIMIADMISAKLQKSFDEVIDKKLGGISWKQINGELGILSSTKTLPRVQVTNEQIQKLRASTGLSEDQIVDGFIIAKKLGKSEKEIIDKIKAGYSREKIYAECYEQKYY